MHFVALTGAISPDKTKQLSKLLREQKHGDTLNLIIDSNGGYISSAYKIIDLIWHYTKRNAFDVYILEKAKSAATFICLGANALYLSDIAELGPIDPQIMQEKQSEELELFPIMSHNSAAEESREIATSALDDMINLLINKTHTLPLNKIISHAINYATQLTKPLLEQIEPHRLAQYQSFIEEVLRYAHLIEKRNNLKNVIDRAKILLFGYPSHDFVINVAELQDIGFNSNYINDTLVNILDMQLENFKKKEGVFAFSIEDSNNKKKNGNAKKTENGR